MDPSAQLLDTVSLLYESALDDERWPLALRSLADLGGGHGTFYIVVDPLSGTVVHSEAVGVDPALNGLYVDHYAAQDVRILPALDYGIGQWMTEDMVLDRPSFERSEIFNDLLVPYEVPWVAATWTEKSAQASALLVIERGMSEGKVSSAELGVLSAASPHVIRGMRARQLGLALRQRAYWDVIEQLPFGVVLPDGHGSVIEMSRPARALQSPGGALASTGLRLHAAHPEDDARLQRAITTTLRSRRLGRLPGATLAVRKTASGRAVTVTIIPASGAVPGLAGRAPAAILFIADPDTARPPATAALRSTFGITDAEARLACLLYTGATLRDCADSLGVTMNTAKTQLRSLYSKAGFRNHVDLANALSRVGLVAPADT